MEINYLIENLKSLLIKYSSDKTQVEENLFELFSSFQTKEGNQNIENFAEFVLLASSLFEIKARRMLPQDDDVEWMDEVEILKDKDLAFARLLQFRAFSEIGIAMASRIKNSENQIKAFKYYQTKSLFPRPDVNYIIERDKFFSVAQEVFTRYKTIEGFKHIDKDLPDLQIAIDQFLKIIDSRLTTSFEEILRDLNSSREAIAFFLALLEAVRWGFVKADQDSIGITIEKSYEL